MPDWDRWHFQRNESATGNLTIVKVYPGTSHTVSFSWQRVGTLDLNVKRDTFDLEPLGQSQTLYLTVNGQTCTGYSTGSLFIQYNWDCSGG